MPKFRPLIVTDTPPLTARLYPLVAGPFELTAGASNVKTGLEVPTSELTVSLM